MSTSNQKITRQDIQLALRVSRTIQEYIEMVKVPNLNTVDVTEYLERKKLFLPHKQKGYYLRQFLHKLRKSENLENLIPQVRYQKPVGNEVMGSWLFNSAKDQMQKVIRVEIIERKEENQPMSFQEAEEIIQLLIEGINPMTDQELPESDACMHPRIQEALHFIISPSNYDEPKPTVLYQKEEVKASIDPQIKLDAFKAEIAGWPFTRKTEYLPEFKQNIRKKYPRAFENWRQREKEILKEAMELTESNDKVAELLQRTKASVDIMFNAL